MGLWWPQRRPQRKSYFIGADMPEGTVKWFNSVWIYSTAGRRQGCACPHLGIERAGLSGLNEGQVVEYEEVSNKGKTSAENLKVQR